MTAKRYEFENEQLTVREIHERVPVLHPSTVARYLARGMKTRREMLSVDYTAIKRSNARAGKQHAARAAYPSPMR